VAPSRRTWPGKVLAILVPIVAIDLVVQYIAGMGTNAYAPAAGFTQNTDFGIYDLHWTNGYVLGVLSIVLVVVAVFSGRARNVASSSVSLAAVLIAAFAGMAFVNSTPNPPWATLTMSFAFLVAFGALVSLMLRQGMPGTTGPVAPAAPGAS
jgi:hypothetical protein